MLKIGVVRWKGRCSKHSAYDPATDGLGGIKGGCRRCEMLLDIHSHHEKLIRAIREFGSRVDVKPKPIDDDAARQMSLLDLT